MAKNNIERTDDGTVKITFTLPWATVEKERLHAAEHMASEVNVPGFRKGKAPIEKVMEKISEEKLVEHTLSHILPEMFSKIIKEENLKPALYPKYNLVKAKEGEDWKVTATTCEIPEVKIADYEKKIKTIKFDKKDNTAPEEKENKIIEKLLESYEFSVPKMLVEEEVQSRLASLLERLERLGLSLENYLLSIKKTADEMRGEYAAQAEKAIKLDLILQYIAVEQKIAITDAEVQTYLQTASMSPEQKETVMLFLRKRKALENLVKLV